MPSPGLAQTLGGQFSVFSVSWSAVLIALAACQLAVGGDMVVGMLPGLCVALGDTQPPTVVWWRGRAR